MNLTRDRMRSIGWAAVLLTCLAFTVVLTFKVNAVKSQVRLAERQILAVKQDKLLLETEFETRANQQQLKALNDMLLNAKQHWASFGSDIAKDVLVSGDAAAGMIYNGFSAKARAEGANVEYAFPKEGYVVWMDNMVLLKDAPNRDNALKFMNFLLDPENAAAITNYAAYSAGVTGVEPFLAPEIKDSPENNPPADQKAFFIEACDEETQKLYDAIWTNLKK